MILAADLAPRQRLIVDIGRGRERARVSSIEEVNERDLMPEELHRHCPCETLIAVHLKLDRPFPIPDTPSIHTSFWTVHLFPDQPIPSG